MCISHLSCWLGSRLCISCLRCCLRRGIRSGLLLQRGEQCVCLTLAQRSLPLRHRFILGLRIFITDILLRLTVFIIIHGCRLAVRCPSGAVLCLQGCQQCVCGRLIKFFTRTGGRCGRVCLISRRHGLGFRRSRCLILCCCVRLCCLIRRRLCCCVRLCRCLRRRIRGRSRISCACRSICLRRGICGLSGIIASHAEAVCIRLEKFLCQIYAHDIQELAAQLVPDLQRKTNDYLRLIVREVFIFEILSVFDLKGDGCGNIHGVSEEFGERCCRRAHHHVHDFADGTRIELVHLELFRRNLLTHHHADDHAHVITAEHHHVTARQSLDI